MSVKRFLSFVPPILLFVFPALAQIQGKLIEMPGTGTFQVSFLPVANVSPPQSTIASAQVMLRAKTGELDVTNFQTLLGSWEFQNKFTAPVEAPGYDYFRFFLVNPLLGVNFTTGFEMPVFSFRNNGQCTSIELVDNATDPFVAGNTLMVNAEIYISMASSGPGGNAYNGNSAQFKTTCPTLSLVVSAAQNPLNCNGDKTNLSVKAVQGKEPYTVVYTNLGSGASVSAVIPTFEGTTSFTNVPAGNYQFKITDAKDSITQLPYSITQPTAISVDLEPGAATCEGSTDGNVVVTKVNGPAGNSLSNYSYFWNVDPTNSNVEIDSLSSGTYTVTVVDPNGCSISAATFVGIYHELFISKQVIDVRCFGENNGIIDIVPFGLAPPYSFHWSPNANTDSDQSAAYLLGPGEYHVTVTAAGGACSRTETFTIKEPEEITLQYELIEPLCHGDAAFLNITSVENTQGTYTINLVGAHTVLSPQNFEIEAGVPVQLEIKDSRGCKITEDFIVPDKPEMIVDLGEDITIKYGESVLLDTEVFPLTGVELIWTPTEYLDCTDCPNPTASPLETTSYRLQMVDQEGCSVEDDIKINVRKSRDLFVPTAFSPNSDNINDRFRPFGGFEVVRIKDMMVFDRWGGLVFSDDDGFRLSDDELGWDGNFNGKVMGTGLYLYTMNVEFIDGETVLFAGEINLIR